MIRKMKKYLLQLTCVMALLGGMTACEGFGTIGGNGGKEEVKVELASCWHLVSMYGSNVNADIYIDFGKDGNFTIYQRTEELTYTVFYGTYTNDEDNSVISGVYDDGTPWLSSYDYVVNEESKTLTLTSVENPSEVAVYELSKAPTSATVKSRCASVSDVKPL